MRTGSLQKVFGPEITVHVAQADGDCFYSCVSWSVGLSKDEIRAIVASGLTEDHFEAYEVAYNCGVPGFGFMKAISTLEALRERISLPKKVWADENSLEIVAQKVAYLLIYNAEAKDGSDRFLHFGQFENPDMPVILLARTRREHYNMISFNGANSKHSAAPKFAKIPESILSLFGIEAPPATKKNKTSHSLVTVENGVDKGDE